MHSRTFLILSVALIFASFAKASVADQNVGSGDRNPGGTMICRQGSSVSTDFPNLRPTPTATCNYSYDEVVSRIGSLFKGDRSRLSVEEIEKVFSIPEMTTQFDDSWTAYYRMEVFGVGGWKLFIDVSEKGSRLGFVAGLSPKRFDQFENNESRVDLGLVAPADSDGRCPEYPFESQAIAAAWYNITGRVMVTDGGRAQPTYQGPDGRSATFVPSAPKGYCYNGILFQKPRPGEEDRGLMHLEPVRPAQKRVDVP